MSAETALGASETSGSSGPSSARFDVGLDPDAGANGPSCTAVDFLFVVDNSGSMASAQLNLVANFPVFIEGIGSTLQTVDSIHVGVTTTDAFEFNTEACRGLGSLVVQTGYDECGPYAEGGNFITEADDLASSFACAARMGTHGSNQERPMAAMLRALGGSLAGPGQCNEGFLRDNALLVIVVITDEWDGPGDLDGDPPLDTSLGDPSSWYQTVVDAKQGFPQNAVAVVLTNYSDGPCDPAVLYPDGLGRYYADGRNMVEFAEKFGANGFVGGICEPDYGPIFAQALDVIDEACDGFAPPG